MLQLDPDILDADIKGVKKDLTKVTRNLREDALDEGQRDAMERQKKTLEHNLREKERLLNEANAKSKTRRLSRTDADTDSAHGDDAAFNLPQKTASLQVSGSPALSLKFSAESKRGAGQAKAPRSPRVFGGRRGQTLQANAAHQLRQLPVSTIAPLPSTAQKQWCKIRFTCSPGTGCTWKETCGHNKNGVDRSLYSSRLQAAARAV